MGDPKKPPPQHAAAPKQKPASPPPPKPADLFLTGFDFLHHPPDAKNENNPGTKARVWAHKDAHAAEKCPLIIYLHGNNLKTKKHDYLQQDYPQLLGPKLDSRGFLHAGKLLTPEIDAGKIVPMVLACPTVFKNGSEMWTSAQFDLSKFVEEVSHQLDGFSGDAHVVIDLDCVAITGHSGAGGNAGNGLNRVVEQNGVFTVDGQAHDLTLLGVMDTKTDVDFGKVIRKGLPRSKQIDVYALHRRHGGWPGSDQSHEGLCKGLNAIVDFDTDAKLEQERDDLLSTEKPQHDPAKPLRRISIAVVQEDPKWNPTLTKWEKIPDAYKQYGWEHHFDVVGLWTVWAARRYFSPGACQKKKDQKAAAPKGSGCDQCDGLQSLLASGDLKDRLKMGSKDSEAVEDLQFHLAEFGYALPKSKAFPDGIDGDYGNGTVKALAAFLDEVKMPGDGKSVTADMVKEILKRHQQGFRTSGAPAAKK